MNKAELINSVAASADVSKKEAEAVVSATFDAITAALKDGDKVQLVGWILRGQEACRPRGPQPQDQGVH